MMLSALKLVASAALLGTATCRRATLQAHSLAMDMSSLQAAEVKDDHWPAAQAAGQVGEVLKLPQDALDSPECAKAGGAEAEGYLLFTENKDTDDRNFNSVDVGFLPGRLQGSVRISLVSTGFLEIVDLARGHKYLSWTNSEVVPYGESLGQLEPNIQILESTSEGATDILIEGSLPSTLLLRVVIYASKSARSRMKEDGVPWKLKVNWLGAKKGCQKPHMTGLKVPFSEMAAMHTLRYMQFMPGYEAVVRRGRDVTMQLPAPSKQEKEGITALMQQQCNASGPVRSLDNGTFTCLPGKLGHACKYSDDGLCVAASSYSGLPLVHLKMASGKDIPLKVSLLQTEHQKADSICKLWNTTSQERQPLLKKLLGFVPSETKDGGFGKGACDRFLGELALASSKGEETCKLQETGECQAVASEGGPVMQVSVHLPAAAEVGRAALFVTDILGTGLPTFAGALAIICNPWSNDDQTYLNADMLRNATYDPAANKHIGWLQGYDDEEARYDYVLKSSTHIFKGAAGNGATDVFGDPWEYHQFRSLYHVLHLLDLLEPSMRGDLVKVTRKIPHLINSYVLAGNWGEIKNGESPSYWSSAADVLSRAHRMSPFAEAGGTSMVRWGQCFVFGGVLGATLRSLGIPARTITNFGSAHDHPNPTYDWIIRKADGDSVWNFHVWNEAWYSRPDLPVVDRASQWNVLDATPQEESDGLMQMGPAAMSAIRRGADDVGMEHVNQWRGENENARSSYDVAFAIGEVNAVQILQTGEDNDQLVQELWAKEGYPGMHCAELCHFLLETEPEERIIGFPTHLEAKTKALCTDSCVPLEEKLLDFYTVGKYMSTEGPRCKDAASLHLDVMGWDDCREDVTANYKSKPCPTDEFCKLMEDQAVRVKDLRMDSRTYLTVSPKVPLIGDIIEVDLWQEQPVPVWLQVKAVAMSYTGKPVPFIEPLLNFAGPFKGINKRLKLQPKDYAHILRTTQYIQITAITWPDLSASTDIDIKGATFFAKKILAVNTRAPELEVLTVGPAPEFKLAQASQRYVGDTVAMRLRWRNPFSTPLEGCKMYVVTPASDVWEQPAPDLAPRSVLEIVSERDMLLDEAGPVELVGALECPGLPLTKERVSFLVAENPNPAKPVGVETTTPSPPETKVNVSVENATEALNMSEMANFTVNMSMENATEALNMSGIANFTANFSWDNETNVSEMLNITANMSWDNATNVSELPNITDIAAILYWDSMNMTNVSELPNVTANMSWDNATNVSEMPNITDMAAILSWDSMNMTNVSELPNVTVNVSWENATEALNVSEPNTTVRSLLGKVFPTTGAEVFPTTPPKCRVGEHVPCCPDGSCQTRCAGDQCCPGRPIGMSGSFTCPSASKSFNMCTHGKITDCTG